MRPPLVNADAPATVVVVDNAAPADVLRVLQQLVKTTPRTTEIVLASMNHHSLPAPVARRVRKLKASSAALLDAAVVAEALAPQLVVVTTSAASFGASWVQELMGRVALYPQVISTVQSYGSAVSLMAYPSAVVDGATAAVLWQTAPGITVRAVAAVAVSTMTLSAVMIVKNEEDVLDECLAALAPFVDEIVVYDTGSTDATMDIARRHGAKLVEGYWDDHFANARNRALAHATGDWVMQVDADEVVTGDARELRARLNVEAHDQIMVTIVSSAWKGVTSGMETTPVRLFRRGTAEWSGALHEYPRPLDMSTSTLSPASAPLKLIHSGYEMGKVIDRDKTTRNVDMARRELDDAGPDSPLRAELLSNLSRSLMWAGRVDEAVVAFDELRRTPGNPTAVVMSGRAAVNLMINTGRLEEADQWLEALAAHGESAGNLSVNRARSKLRAGDAEGARAEIAPFIAGANGGTDPWALPFDRAQLDLVSAEISMISGDVHTAAQRFIDVTRAASHLIDLNVALQVFVAAGEPLTALAEAAPEALIARSVREAASYHPSGALAWFDALHLTDPEDLRPVVAGNMFADRADWRTALTWSARAREMGLHDVCALRGLGERESAPLLDRCVAWAVLSEVFAAEESSSQFELLTQRLEVAETETLVGTLLELGIDVTALDNTIGAPA